MMGVICAEQKTMKTRLLMGLISLLSGVGACAAADVDRGGKHSLSAFVGQATDTNFVESMYAPWSNDLKDVGVAGAMYSYRLGTLGDVFGLSSNHFTDHVTVETEGGGAFRFGDEDLGELWTGLYVRYDGFFWNDTVYTTLAVNTGLSLLSSTSDFERGRDSRGKNGRLLHYMGPEISIADPQNKNLELIFRYHHRSGVFGLFDGVVSGSTFLSSGVRVRF
jgi:hypothetical protein